MLLNGSYLELPLSVVRSPSFRVVVAAVVDAIHIDEVGVSKGTRVDKGTTGAIVRVQGEKLDLHQAVVSSRLVKVHELDLVELVRVPAAVNVEHGASIRGPVARVNTVGGVEWSTTLHANEVEPRPVCRGGAADVDVRHVAVRRVSARGRVLVLVCDASRKRRV